MKPVRYDPRLKLPARGLRNNSTKAEVVLWRHLRGMRMLGWDFHRQKPVGGRIIDFYCPRLRLAIEVDGHTHKLEEIAEDDRKRESELGNQGIRVIRFWNEEVFKDIGSVLRQIEAAVTERVSSAGTHPASGNRGAKAKSPLCKRGFRGV